jgi:hypothetical protein
MAAGVYCVGVAELGAIPRSRYDLTIALGVGLSVPRWASPLQCSGAILTLAFASRWCELGRDCSSTS